MVALDTDVLAIFHIFHNDPRYQTTKSLIDKLNGQTKAVSIFNLLELCGILASANRIKDSKNLFEKYLSAEDVVILFPEFAEQDKNDFWSMLVSECFYRIQRGFRLGDAVILWVLETNENIDTLITWNIKHFKDKTSIRVLTPSDFS